MYFTLFWGQCHFSGGRLEDFQTTAFQWIDSASLKAISAGETISTLVPGRRRLMSGCWCHVSLWMNISCAAPSSTSASPSLLCLLALHCPLHLWFLYSFFSPALEHAAATNTRAGLMAPHEHRVHSTVTPSSPWMPVGVPPFAEVVVAVCESAPYGKRGLS